MPDLHLINNNGQAVAVADNRTQAQRAAAALARIDQERDGNLEWSETTGKLMHRNEPNSRPQWTGWEIRPIPTIRVTP